jgi:UDP-N-acetyl-D-glucosamine dehydrogenase
MNSGSNRVAVIGQGYVGLPLAVAANNAGFEVIGIDSDAERISMLSSGTSPIEDVSSAEISKALGNVYQRHWIVNQNLI